MGEDASARTQRELADLRAAIGRDVDALVARVREDVDPRNLLRRQPLAVAGSLASLAAAAGLGAMRRAREAQRKDGLVDALVDRFGGRIDKMKGRARKEFRKQLRKELAEVEGSGLREAIYRVVTAALTALAATMAQRFGSRLLGDERAERESEPRPR